MYQYVWENPSEYKGLNGRVFFQKKKLLPMRSNSCLNPLHTGNLKTGTYANSEDPDEMSLQAAFYQGLHCLLRQNQSSEKEIQYIGEIITCEH